MKTKIMALLLLGLSGADTLGREALRGKDPAATAINLLGLDLLQKTGGQNTILSPYSIQSALAMTFAGAAGETKKEMGAVLHYPSDEPALHKAFAQLQQALLALEHKTQAQADNPESGGDPLRLFSANRLFGQKTYAFRDPFLSFLKDTYSAPLQELDFVLNPTSARKEINEWVSAQTQDRIQDLIPPDGINRDTRLVLVNAIHLKAPWTEPFPSSATQPRPFYTKADTGVEVPTMMREGSLGYAKKSGFTAVTVPYRGNDLQFLILVPDERSGLASLENSLTAEALASFASIPQKPVRLYLPKFKMEPPLMKLSAALQDLGMKSAFDIPRGSANFDGMAPRRPNDYLCISEVFHKTFLALDEQGTEAAAATAVSMVRVTSALQKPAEVRVDRPFIFGIQHRPTGACLFLGRIVDPR